MDVLSDAITAMRTGRPHAGHNRRAVPWGLRFPPAEGAGFHIVLRGSAWVFPQDGEPVRLDAGDVALLPGGRSYGIADSPQTELREVTLGPDGLLPLLPETRGDGAEATLLLCGTYLLSRARPHPLLAELPPVVHLSARSGRHQALRSVIDLLSAELTDHRPGSGTAVPALLDTLLLYILRAWFEEQRTRTGTGWAAALSDPAIGAALEAIHAEPAHGWTVGELGARAGLSRAAFARRFTALVGRPPLGYLTWWRMTSGSRLLRESEAPLRVVAQQTGYVSEFAFAKAFKREYDLSPGRYREQHRASSA